jgi:predicted nucleotidyltransferase
MVAEPKIQVPLEHIQAFCDKWKVTEFALFGSVLRDDFGPDSDVDVVVSFKPAAGWSLWDLVDMESDLEAIYGRGADLIEKEGLKNPFADTKSSPPDGCSMPREQSDASFLWDMLTAARAVASFVAGRTFEQYERDLLLRSAVERQIEIIGEAARRITRAFRDQHPEITNGSRESRSRSPRIDQIPGPSGQP